MGETASGTESSFASRLRGLFLGSILRKVGTVVLGLVLVGAVAVAAGAVGVPAVQGVHNEFAGVNDSTTVIASEIEVQNPNPIGAGFLGVSAEYDISMNDVRMANGSSGQISIPPGNSSIALETALDNDRIPAWWTTHVQRDEETTVDINATVDSDLLGRSVPVRETRTIETDMLSSFNSTETRPVNADSVLVDDPILYVNETAAQWGETTEDRTGIVLDFYVYNPKPYAIPISKLNYTIGMNDVQVGSGENTDEKLLPPGETTRVRTVTYIDNQKLDDWWVTHIERDQVTELEIDFGATLEVSGTSVTVPLEEFTHRETIRTDLFGTKNETANGTAGGNETTGDDEAGTEESAGEGTTTDDGSSGGGTTSEDGETTDDGTTSEDDGTTTDDDSTTTDDGGIVPTVGYVTTEDGGIAPVLRRATALTPYD